MASYVGKVTGTDGTTGPIGSTLYGTCSTAAATVAKEVTLANFDELLTGVTIHVKFTNSNTASSPTLNVNGTGAKSIYRYGTTVPSTSASWSWYAGAVVSFTYDGSAWIMNDMIGNDNTYDRTSMQTRIYAGTKGVFPYCICALDNEQRMQAMTTTGGTATTKAFNSSEKFLYPPVIMYHSANSTIADGSVIANNVLYEQYPSVDLRYSCNITTSAGFTQYKPVYIECSFDTNGYWSPSGITQTFVAGKFYILLGCMYSTSIYQLALFAEHPVYYCETAGTIKKWELLGAKYKNGFWGITNPYGVDTNWTRTTRNGLIPYAPNENTTDGNSSSLGTSTWSFVNGYINNLYYKDLKPINVVAGGTDDNGIDKMAGNYFFYGNNLIGGINDWVGLQAGYSGDKWQLIGGGGSSSTVGKLFYRQNDVGGTNIDSWSSWTGLLTPDKVDADTGLSVSVVTSPFGSGTTAEDIPIGVKISHTNSVTAQTDFDKPYVQYDAQGHITESSHFVHTAAGTGGETGWVKIATLKHTKTYDNTPIMLTISQRGNTINFRLHIVFLNANNTDPELGQFLLVSDHAWESINARAYMIKSATSTWDLYILKLDSYEAIAVSSFDVGRYFTDHITWTWKDEQTAASAITGGTEATKKVYSTSDHTHNYVPNTSAGVSAALNLLTTGSTNPGLNDYYISQYANGGTTTTTYHRRPLLSLWNTFKALVTVETTGSGNAITSATIANDGNNRKITFTKGSTFSLSNHTHNYAGSSSAGGAATSANKLNTDAGSEVQPVYFSGGIPVVTHIPASGEYYGVPQIRQGDGVMEIGTVVDFHSDVTSSNDYDVRLLCNDTNILTLSSKGGTSTLRLSGTLPRLRFSQTTSSSAYNSEQCGISAYPGNTAGVNLVMQSGGNEFVGAGESPSNLYYRVITTDTNPYGTSSFIGNEKMFLTSDNEIYFVSGANGLSNTAYTDWTNLKTVLLDNNGCFRPSITEKGSIGSESYEWHSSYIHNMYGTFNHIKTNPTSGTIYGVSFHMGANTGEPKYLRTSDGIRCSLVEGTTSAKGYGALILGNNITSGTALNKYGLIRMYGSGSNYIQLSAGSDDDTLRFFCINTGGSYVTGANMSPATNDIYDLGTSSLRWRNVYARSLDGNLRSAFIYSNESNASSYPWHKFAETTVTAANTDSIITFLMSRTMNSGDKIAILSVRIRTGGTKVLASTSSWVHFNYINGDAFDPNDIVAVYTDTANTSCKVELYVKSATRYNGVIATVLKEHSRVGTIDNWTLVEYTASANGVASVPAGTGHLTMLSTKQEVLYEKTGGFTKSAYNTVTFSKPVFGVYKLALLIIDQCQIETNSYENAATYILPLDYIKSLGVDPYPPYLTGTGWSTKNNTYVNIPGPESDPWDVAVTYVSDTSLQFSKNGNTNMATNQATVQIIGIM